MNQSQFLRSIPHCCDQMSHVREPFCEMAWSSDRVCHPTKRTSTDVLKHRPFAIFSTIMIQIHHRRSTGMHHVCVIDMPFCRLGGLPKRAKPKRFRMQTFCKKPHQCKKKEHWNSGPLAQGTFWSSEYGTAPGAPNSHRNEEEIPIPEEWLRSQTLHKPKNFTEKIALQIAGQSFQESKSVPNRRANQREAHKAARSKPPRNPKESSSYALQTAAPIQENHTKLRVPNRRGCANQRGVTQSCAFQTAARSKDNHTKLRQNI